MAHNSAHYSLVNVGVGFMQCYDRTRVNPRPSLVLPCVHSIMITTNQFHFVKWPTECLLSFIGGGQLLRVAIAARCSLVCV